jgi:hypothetical protein
METIFAILNALNEGFSEEVVTNAVETWLTIQRVKAFVKENPGLYFTNEGMSWSKPLSPAAEEYTPESSDVESGLQLLAEAVAELALSKIDDDEGPLAE